MLKYLGVVVSTASCLKIKLSHRVHGKQELQNANLIVKYEDPHCDKPEPEDCEISSNLFTVVPVHLNPERYECHNQKQLVGWDKSWNIKCGEKHGYSNIYLITPPHCNDFGIMSVCGEKQAQKLTDMLENEIGYNSLYNTLFCVSDDKQCQQYINTCYFKNLYEKVVEKVTKSKQGSSENIFIQSLNCQLIPKVQPNHNSYHETAKWISLYDKTHMEYAFRKMMFFSDRERGQTPWNKIFICPKFLVGYVVKRLMQVNVNVSHVGNFDVGDATVTEIRVSSNNKPFVNSIGTRAYLDYNGMHNYH